MGITPRVFLAGWLCGGQQPGPIHQPGIFLLSEIALRSEPRFDRADSYVMFP